VITLPYLHFEKMDGCLLVITRDLDEKRHWRDKQSKIVLTANWSNCVDALLTNQVSGSSFWMKLYLPPKRTRTSTLVDWTSDIQLRKDREPTWPICGCETAEKERGYSSVLPQDSPFLDPTNALDLSKEEVPKEYGGADMIAKYCGIASCCA